MTDGESGAETSDSKKFSLQKEIEERKKKKAEAIKKEESKIPVAQKEAIRRAEMTRPEAARDTRDKIGRFGTTPGDRLEKASKEKQPA